jgi:hypothetical protein
MSIDEGALSGPHETPAGKSEPIIRPGDDIEAEPRTGGLVRGVLKRSASGGCLDCGVAFDNIGAACAHARGARHRVQASYSATYVYMPAESLPGGVE